MAASPLRLEMGIGHADLLRLLPAALGGRAFEREGEEIRVAVDGGEVRIRIGPEGRRSLGAIRLPVTELELRFTGLGEAQIAAFLQRFRSAFQKGGG